MSKQEQFLWAVQTIALGEMVARGPIENPNRRPDMLQFVGTALSASEKIPDEMEVFKAALQFCGYMIPRTPDPDARCPAWFAE